MASERTSSLCVYAGSSLRPLGASITSSDAAVTVGDTDDSGCDMTEDRMDGSGSSSGDDVSGGRAPSQPCYRHIVSHVEQRLKLLKDAEILAINGMPLLHWNHDAVCNQILCQGIGEFSLIVKYSRRRELYKTKITVTLGPDEGDVMVKAERQRCSADVIHKDIHLLDDNWQLAKYHWTTGSGNKVIVLRDESVIVQTLQHDTQPCNVYVFRGVETDRTKPQCDSKVVVLAFKSNETGFYFLCVRDGNNVALQRCDNIQNSIDNGYLSSSTDSRYFYQTTVRDDNRVFESTELADHYLSCDGQKLFIKTETDRSGVRDGKFPELNFKFRNAGQ